MSTKTSLWRTVLAASLTSFATSVVAQAPDLQLVARNLVRSAMTASNIEELKAAYAAAGGGKDQFAFVDIGLNPETKLPLGSGRVVWTAPGSVTVGLGDNRGFGGTNASDFALVTQLPEATLKVDGTTVIDQGSLR